MKLNIIQTKKGIALNQAFGAVLVLVLIGVLVIIAIFLFTNLNTTFDATQDNSAVNESLSIWTANVNQTLAGSTSCGFGTVTTSGIVIYNATNEVIITAPNYTVFDTGIIQNDTDTFSIFAWQVTYSYTDGGAACNATTDMITQFGNYPALVGLIGTIIFLGIVIGVLVASFVFGGRRKQGI